MLARCVLRLPNFVTFWEGFCARPLGYLIHAHSMLKSLSLRKFIGRPRKESPFRQKCHGQFCDNVRA